MVDYYDDSIQPDYSIGGTISFGGGQPVSGTVSAGVGTAPSAGCVNCGARGFFATLSLPVVLLIVAVLVLALRK